MYSAPRQTKNEFAKEHGATFPVHLPEFILTELMNKATGIVDCFCGTGTSIIAAEKNGRIGYGIELSRQYCDLIIRRWQAFSGDEAVHIASGKKFNEMRNQNVTNSESERSDN